LVSDVGGSGLRTLKAEKAAVNRRRAMSNKVPEKQQQKKHKVSIQNSCEVISGMCFVNLGMYVIRFL
jgi:hypothetical protein